MTNAEVLTLLKIDLQISATSLDTYLSTLIDAAHAFIEKEGITLNESAEDGLLVEMYAAYLYRKRREADAGMPRMLRWAMNNRLFGGQVDG